MYDWDLGDAVFNAWVRLRQVWEAVKKYSELELEPYQATFPQIDILMILSVSTRPLTPTEIASYVFRELHSVSEFLTRMEKSGYVKKVRSRKDRRVVRVHIQPKGEELLRQTVGSGFPSAYRIMRSYLSEEEIKQLDLLLKKLRDGALQEMGLKAEPLPDILDARGMVSS